MSNFQVFHFLALLSSLAAPTTWWPVLLFLSSALGVGEVSAAPPPTPEHAAFSANDVAGQLHLAAETGVKATVWVFIAHDCPLCNAYAPELNRIEAEYTPRGAKVNRVYAESDLSTKELKQHAQAYGYKAALFSDPGLRLAKACGVAVTPEVAVVGSDGVIIYRGRIDNRSLEIGRIREQTTVFDLRSALSAYLAGRPVPVARTTAMGCVLNLP